MTNNKQQTAVDWLSEKVLHREWELLTQEKKRKILEQAKEMEKEQIQDAYKADTYPIGDDEAEQYYNETYGGGEQ